MPQIRGSAWLSNLEYLKKTFSPEDVEKVKAALPPAVRHDFFERVILPVTWIDFKTFIDVNKTMDKILGGGNGRITRESAIYSANHDFKGMYRFFISLASPKMVIENVGR